MTKDEQKKHSFAKDKFIEDNLLRERKRITEQKQIAHNLNSKSNLSHSFFVDKISKTSHGLPDFSY